MTVKYLVGEPTGRKIAGIALIADAYMEDSDIRIFSTEKLRGIKYVKMDGDVDLDALVNAIVLMELKNNNDIKLANQLSSQSQRRALTLILDTTKTSISVKELDKYQKQSPLGEIYYCGAYDPISQVCNVDIRRFHKDKGNISVSYYAPQYFKCFSTKDLLAKA